MAFAKQTIPTVDVGVFRVLEASRRLFFPSVLLSLACGAIAFVFLFWRDGTHVNVMVNEQSAPSLRRLAEAVPPPASGVVSSPQPQASTTTSQAEPATNPGKNDFTIAKLNQTTSLGPVEVRLTRIDPGKALYDLDVKSGRRFSPHRRLRLNQPLWITAARGRSSVKITVTSLTAASVSGNWIPSNQVAQINSRAHGKRR